MLLDIKVKELDKRASGQAFEVILRDPAPEAKGDFPLSPQKKKDWSLEEIQKKLEAAEERRKVHLKQPHLLAVSVSRDCSDMRHLCCSYSVKAVVRLN